MQLFLTYSVCEFQGKGEFLFTFQVSIVLYVHETSDQWKLDCVIYFLQTTYITYTFHP